MSEQNPEETGVNPELEEGDGEVEIDVIPHDPADDDEDDVDESTPDLGEMPEAEDDPDEAAEGAELNEDEDPGEAEPDDPFAAADGSTEPPGTA